MKSHIDSEAHGTPDGVDKYRHFFYNTSWQLLETRVETRGSQYENTAPDELHLEYQYVRSLRYIDALVLRDENRGTDDDLCDDERLYYTTDANMNVTALLEDDGDVAERYAYDPYGSVTTMDPNWTVDTTPDYDNHILYCGYYLDWETGLYHVRHRMYHAQLGRWMQRDPLKYVDGLNLYQYASSTPGTRVDPLGQDGGATATAGAVIAGAALGYNVVENALQNKAGDVSWEFDKLEGTVFVGDKAQPGLNGWRLVNLVVDFHAENEYGNHVVTIKWEVDYYILDGHISQVIPGIVNTGDLPCWGGSVEMEVSVVPGDLVWTGGEKWPPWGGMAGPPVNPKNKSHRTVELRVVYTAESFLASRIAVSKWRITGDGVTYRRSWEDNGERMYEDGFGIK